MNNDIKEILELYKNNDIEYYNLVSDLGYDKLLDCIIKLQEKLNLAENILYDYLYKDNKITKELYDKFKGSDE